MKAEPATPIFVVGNSRSGTTMMGRILGGHKSVFTFHELHFFEQLWSPTDAAKELTLPQAIDLYSRLLKAQRSGILKNHDYRMYLEPAAKALQSLDSVLTRSSVFSHFLNTESSENGKTIPCEQTPRNLLYIEEILSLFPDSKIVVMVRDPRDVLLSQKRKWKRRLLGGAEIPWVESFRSWVNYHPVTISKLWATNYRIVEKWKAHPSVVVVSFEMLVNSPMTELHRICAFLGLSYHSQLLHIPVIGSSNTTDSFKTGIVPTASGRWKSEGLTKAEVFICQKICATGMAACGYESASIKPPLLNMVGSFFSFPIKLAGALMLNLKRMRNIKDALKRRITLSR